MDFFPELVHGFTGPVPYHRSLPVPGPGRWRVRLVLGGWTEPTRLTVFLGRRRCVLAGLPVVPGQEVVLDRTETVGPFIPRGQVKPFPIEGLHAVVTGGPWIRSFDAEPAPGAPTVHLAGDSTVTDQTADWPWDPGATYCGWGQMLPLFLSDRVGVANQAHSGLTTESFRTEGHGALMDAALNPGDLVLFQFGHNDQKLPYLAADTGYRRNLERLVAKVRSRGARPVLVSPVTRALWTAPGGAFHDLLADQARVCAEVAADLGTALVDLHSSSVAAVLARGPDGVLPWFHPGDTTHHNDFGGLEMARLVAEGLRQALPDLSAWWSPCPPGDFGPPRLPL